MASRFDLTIEEYPSIYFIMAERNNSRNCRIVCILAGSLDFPIGKQSATGNFRSWDSFPRLFPSGHGNSRHHFLPSANVSRCSFVDSHCQWKCIGFHWRESLIKLVISTWIFLINLLLVPVCFTRWSQIINDLVGKRHRSHEISQRLN